MQSLLSTDVFGLQTATGSWIFFLFGLCYRLLFVTWNYKLYNRSFPTHSWRWQCVKNDHNPLPVAVCGSETSELKLSILKQIAFLLTFHMRQVSFIFQWRSVLPDAKMSKWSHLMLRPVVLIWSVIADGWLHLVKELKGSVFLSWSRLLFLFRSWVMSHALDYTPKKYLEQKGNNKFYYLLVPVSRSP